MLLLPGIPQNITSRNIFEVGPPICSQQPCRLGHAAQAPAREVRSAAIRVILETLRSLGARQITWRISRAGSSTGQIQQTAVTQYPQGTSVRLW